MNAGVPAGEQACGEAAGLPLAARAAQSALGLASMMGGAALRSTGINQLDDHAVAARGLPKHAAPGAGRVS
jgi:hypothetical protein